MPIRIVLRKDGAQSPFRQMMGKLLSCPVGDSAVICSGYIWEGKGYSVLNDGLLSMIQQGCAKGVLTTVAGKFSHNYYSYYRDFIRKLRASGVMVNPLYASKKNWHAKVAIRLINGKAPIPVAALVGSSNLTAPAFGMGVKRWNYEADVLIWSNSEGLSSHFKNDDSNLKLGNIETILDPGINQPSEEDQLQSIYSDVINEGLRQFEL